MEKPNYLPTREPMARPSAASSSDTKEELLLTLFATPSRLRRLLTECPKEPYLDRQTGSRLQLLGIHCGLCSDLFDLPLVSLGWHLADVSHSSLPCTLQPSSTAHCPTLSVACSGLLARTTKSAERLAYSDTIVQDTVW